MKRKRVILSVIGVLVALPLLAACAAPAPAPPAPAPPAPAPAPPAPAPPAPAPVEVIKWRFAATASRGMIHFEQVDKLTAEELIAMSDGRLDVTIYGVGEIIEADELFAACKAGTVDMSTSWGYHVGEVPFDEVFYQLPMGLRNASEAAVLLYERGAYELAKEVYLAHNVHFLPPQTPTGIYPIYHSGVPIRSLDDIKGFKIRSYGAFASTHEKLGATVVWIPFAELYTAVATGVIDGFSNPTLGESVDMKFYEVCRYAIMPAFCNYLMASQFVNMDSWNGLTADLQAIIHAAAIHASLRHDHVYLNLDQSARPIMEAAGVEFIELPPEDYAQIGEIAREVWDECAAKDPTGYATQFIEIYKDYMEELGR